MDTIVQKLAAVSGLRHLKGCSQQQLEQAQKELGINFPREYIEYVTTFGAVCFFATEWTGLNVSGHLDVVHVTKQERSLDNAFPRDCFVVENIGIDGLLTVMDECGKVYSYQHGKKSLLCDSLADYLIQCIARKKQS